eukprot:COSAG02_NODE_3026_length_7517_cov_4.200593_3_plen_53_part_00
MATSKAKCKYLQVFSTNKCDTGVAVLSCFCHKQHSPLVPVGHADLTCRDLPV